MGHTIVQMETNLSENGRMDIEYKDLKYFPWGITMLEITKMIYSMEMVPSTSFIGAELNLGEMDIQNL